MSGITLPRLGMATGSRRHAIVCVCAASALFAFAGAMVKALAPYTPTMEMVLFRSGVSVLVLLVPLIQKHQIIAALRTKNPWGHFTRTSVGFVGMYGSYYGYAHLPLATVTAIGFAMPLFLAILSYPLLGERVGPVRAGAVIAGLAGVLIMVRPWQDDASSLPLVPVVVLIVGVIAWALAMISIRRMGAVGERNVTIVLWYSMGSALLGALFCIPVWVMPSPLVFAGLCGVGLLSALAQMLMTQGYRSAETTLVAPFEYGSIIYTTIIGLLLWGEVPDLFTALGILIVVASGMVVWRTA